MHIARATCKTKGCQLCNNCNILVTTWPITLKLGMHVGTHPAIYIYVSQLGCDSRTQVQGNDVADLENGWINRAKT